MFEYVIISDTHLGMEFSHPKILLNFLKSIECKNLILNGDIIDMLALQRGSKWTGAESSVINQIIKMSKKTNIIYIRGNHDDPIKHLTKIRFKNILFKENYIVYVGNKSLLVLHGDIFDSKLIKNKMAYQIGSIAYDVMLRVNQIYNAIRKTFNLPYKSISKIVKRKVKGILSFISDFENNAIEEARIAGCDGVICGHIHTPSRKVIDGMIYLNSGDWIESFSAIGIKSSGEIEVIHYQ